MDPKGSINIAAVLDVVSTELIEGTSGQPEPGTQRLHALARLYLARNIITKVCDFNDRVSIDGLSAGQNVQVNVLDAIDLNSDRRCNIHEMLSKFWRQMKTLMANLKEDDLRDLCEAAENDMLLLPHGILLRNIDKILVVASGTSKSPVLSCPLHSGCDKGKAQEAIFDFCTDKSFAKIATSIRSFVEGLEGKFAQRCYELFKDLRPEISVTRCSAALVVYFVTFQRLTALPKSAFRGKTDLSRATFSKLGMFRSSFFPGHYLHPLSTIQKSSTPYNPWKTFDEKKLLPRESAYADKFAECLNTEVSQNTSIRNSKSFLVVSEETWISNCDGLADERSYAHVYNLLRYVLRDAFTVDKYFDQPSSDLPIAYSLACYMNGIEPAKLSTREYCHRIFRGSLSDSSLFVPSCIKQLLDNCFPLPIRWICDTFSKINEGSPALQKYGTNITQIRVPLEYSYTDINSCLLDVLVIAVGKDDTHGPLIRNALANGCLKTIYNSSGPFLDKRILEEQVSKCARLLSDRDSLKYNTHTCFLSPLWNTIRQECKYNMSLAVYVLSAFGLRQFGLCTLPWMQDVPLQSEHNPHLPIAEERASMFHSVNAIQRMFEEEIRNSVPQKRSRESESDDAVESAVHLGL